MLLKIFNVNRDFYKLSCWAYANPTHCISRMSDMVISCVIENMQIKLTLFLECQRLYKLCFREYSIPTHIISRMSETCKSWFVETMQCLHTVFLECQSSIAYVVGTIPSLHMVFLQWWFLPKQISIGRAVQENFIKYDNEAWVWCEILGLVCPRTGLGLLIIGVWTVCKWSLLCWWEVVNNGAFTNQVAIDVHTSTHCTHNYLDTRHIWHDLQLLRCIFLLGDFFNNIVHYTFTICNLLLLIIFI